MKITLKILSLMGLLIPLTGCIRDRYDNCPSKDSYKVSLDFSLQDDNGKNVFDSVISSADIGIYSTDGMLVTLRHLSKTELSRFRGIELTLDPGTYHVVGWGNIGDNVQHNGVDALHPYGYHVTYNNINAGRVTQADKVYYAPLGSGRSRAADLSGAYRMTVDPVTGHAGVLEFTAAHRTVNIYIEGFNGTPGVELLNLPEGLVWCGMTWLTDHVGSKLMLTASQETTPEKKEDIWYDYASFDTFYFDKDNNIILNITDQPTHEPVFSIALNEALEKIGFPTGTVISIVLKFTQTGAEIGLPQWENHEVDAGPEL